MTPFVPPPPFAKTGAGEVFSAPSTLEPPRLMAGRNLDPAKKRHEAARLDIRRAVCFWGIALLTRGQLRGFCVSQGALLRREVTGRIVNPHACYSSPLCIGERLKVGVSGRQGLRKSLGIGCRAECANADRGEDWRFGVCVMANMNLHHGSERQSAAMLDDSRHMRPHAPEPVRKRPRQGTIIRSAASCS